MRAIIYDFAVVSDLAGLGLAAECPVSERAALPHGLSERVSEPQGMGVPEGYVSLGGAVEYVARIREPDAVAALTPDGFAFFAQLDAAMRPRVAPPAAPIRSIRAGGSPGPVRDLRPAAPAVSAPVEQSPEAKAKADAQLKRWTEARQKLAAARDGARSDLRRALVSGTVRAAAIGEDGDLVTMPPARWRVTFERPRIAGLEPFAEALEGRTVPTAASGSGTPTAWGRAIIARADLARWCGGPPEPEPAERPRDWAAPPLAPQPVPRDGAWWTTEQALAWVAFGRAAAWENAREQAGVPDGERALARLRAAQLRLSEAIADGKLRAWGQETADMAKAPLRDTLVPLPPEDFAGHSALTLQLNGWAYPPKLDRRYEGRWWQGISFEAAAVRAVFPAAPAVTDLPEWWTLTQASAWIALRDTAAVRDAGPPRHDRDTHGVVRWHLEWAWRQSEHLEVGPNPAEADEVLLAAARRGGIRGRGTPHTSPDSRELQSADWALATIAEDQQERGAKYLCPARGAGPHWRGVLVARDDIVREWPPFVSAEPELAEPSLAAPVPTEATMTAESLPARANPGQAYSREALGAWFYLRVKTWPKGELPPSEPECIAAAKLYFADPPGRDEIREIRKQKTPKSWRKRGPRPRR